MADKCSLSFRLLLKKMVAEKEDTIIIGMKSVYCLAKENLPMHKYTSLLELLSSVDCKITASLSQVKNASYSSETTANDMLQSLASVITSDIGTQLQILHMLVILLMKTQILVVRKNIRKNVRP